MTFDEQHAVYRARCEEALSIAVKDYFMPMSVVAEAAQYSLLNGGKRVRGVITLAVCDLLGGDFQAADVFAAAIEMIHAFSLVHDDLPCMDDDDMRRGKPANHIVYGQANALLAGDVLAIAPFELMARAPLAAATRTEAIGILAAAAGGRGMVYGQELDIKYEGREVDEATLCAIQQNKTGALISAAAELGAAAAGLNMKDCPAIAQYADNIGLVFQIADDILDTVSTQEELGKPVGSDARKAKATFVSVNGLEAARKSVQRFTAQAILGLQQAYGESGWFLSEYAKKLAARTN